MKPAEQSLNLDFTLFLFQHHETEDWSVAAGSTFDKKTQLIKNKTKQK